MCVCVCVCVCVYTYIFFIPLSVDGHLGCFRVLTILSSVMSAGIHGFFFFSKLKFSSFLGIYSAVGLAGSYVALFLVF